MKFLITIILLTIIYIFFSFLGEMILRIIGFLMEHVLAFSIGISVFLLGKSKN